jgi:hypothetical protein
LKNNAFLAELRAPDTNNILRPLHQLLINDAPWILARVKTADVVHIAHRRLGANRSLARALRLRLLSEAVVEEVDESHMDVPNALSGATRVGDGESLGPDTPEVRGADASAELPVELLLRELAPYVVSKTKDCGAGRGKMRLRVRDVGTGCEKDGVGEAAASALLHRLLWLIDLQLENSQSSAAGDGSDGSDNGAKGVAVWNAERFCQRLQRLPCHIVKVDKVASRFMLLQADALAPCPLEDGGLPEAWRDAQTRIDITNPLRRFDSVLVLDEQHNALVVKRALLQLPAVMLSKLADALNRCVFRFALLMRPWSPRALVICSPCSVLAGPLSSM